MIFKLTGLKTGLNADNEFKVVSFFGYSSVSNTMVFRLIFTSTGVISSLK